MSLPISNKLFAPKFDCLSAIVIPQTDNLLLEMVENNPISPLFALPDIPHSPFQLESYFLKQYRELTGRPFAGTSQISAARKLLADFDFDLSVRAIVYMLRNNHRYKIRSLHTVYISMPEFIRTYFPEHDSSTPTEQ